MNNMIVVVTGGTRGISAACVEHLCGFTATVAFCSREQDDCDRCSSKLKQGGFSGNWGMPSDHSQRLKL